MKSAKNTAKNQIGNPVKLISVLFTLFVLTLLPVNPAMSGIRACTLPDGTVTYQDSVCPSEPELAAARSKEPRKQTLTVPFGIHQSWFEIPSVDTKQVVCNEAGCYCGAHSRIFTSGLADAVAGALYLDGSWHRLDSVLLQLKDPSLSDAKRTSLQKESVEVACNIQMSQSTLSIFGPQALNELREKKFYAENRGLDFPEDCEAGNSEVCYYTDIIAKYDRIQTDAKLLRVPKQGSGTDESLATR